MVVYSGYTKISYLQLHRKCEQQKQFHQKKFTEIISIMWGKKTAHKRDQIYRRTVAKFDNK